MELKTLNGSIQILDRKGNAGKAVCRRYRRPSFENGQVDSAEIEMWTVMVRRERKSNHVAVKMCSLSNIFGPEDNNEQFRIYFFSLCFDLTLMSSKDQWKHQK